MSEELEGLRGLTEIGRGGFGVVFKAVETDLGRTVAVKLLPTLVDEAATRRFERERLALGAMSTHPHIITIHRSGRAPDGRPYLVMEFCEQGSIADELERTGPLPWPRATELGVKLAGALETAHRAGIVHRDIKPANVLVSNLGEPKLADFGIARMDGAPETQSATITASLAHAAPEIIAGRRPDARSDVYGLGSTLYEFLAGVPAFVDATDESMLPILNRIARDPMPPFPPQVAVPPAVEAVIRQAMAKEPADRPASAAEFGHLL
ncbi:MAG: serine/threonine-protein kinase, partial [Actinomycetota bacterium]